MLKIGHDRTLWGVRGRAANGLACGKASQPRRKRAPIHPKPGECSVRQSTQGPLRYLPSILAEYSRWGTFVYFVYSRSQSGVRTCLAPLGDPVAVARAPAVWHDSLPARQSQLSDRTVLRCTPAATDTPRHLQCAHRTCTLRCAYVPVECPCQTAVLCQCASAVQRDCKHQRPGARCRCCAVSTRTALTRTACAPHGARVIPVECPCQTAVVWQCPSAVQRDCKHQRGVS